MLTLTFTCSQCPARVEVPSNSMHHQTNDKHAKIVAVTVYVPKGWRCVDKMWLCSAKCARADLIAGLKTEVLTTQSKIRELERMDQCP